MSFKTFLIDRYGGSNREVSIWYHGTHPRNTQDILHQGLVPDVKDKEWEADPNRSFRTPDRTTYGGIYVTTNLMTAKSAPRDKDAGVTLVIMRLQPRTFAVDEDDFTRELSKINTDYGRGTVEVSEAAEMYFVWKFYDQLPTREQARIDKSLENYTESFFHTLENIHDLDVHPKLKDRIEEMIPSIYVTALKRGAAYAYQKDDRYTYWKQPYYRVYDIADGSLPEEPPEGPSVNQAESQFRKKIDQLTKTVSDVARPVVSGDGFNQTARILEPVNFKGSNKIISIITLLEGRHIMDKYSVDLDDDLFYTTFIDKVYTPNGLPQKFIKDFQNRVDPDGPRYLSELGVNT